jgi:hypothetical protein
MNEVLLAENDDTRVRRKGRRAPGAKVESLGGKSIPGLICYNSQATQAVCPRRARPAARRRGAGEAPPSRRKRKRYRRRAANQAVLTARPRGDRSRPPTEDFGKPSGGFGGRSAGLWCDASRSDLLLLRKSIQEDWPVSDERRAAILREALSALHREGTTDRKVLALIRLGISAQQYDLDLMLANKRRAGRRLTVEECTSMDAITLASLSWSSPRDWTDPDSSLSYSFSRILCEPDWMVFRVEYERHCTATKQPQRGAFPLCVSGSQTRFGGTRWRFLCPIDVRGDWCHRSVSRLYLRPGGRIFGCRHCHQLSYKSRQSSRKGAR